jgi:hypothetical protein
MIVPTALILSSVTQGSLLTCHAGFQSANVRTRCPHDESGRMPELLIQIRLREWKGVLDQFDPRFRVLSNDNFNYVEAKKYIRVL